MKGCQIAFSFILAIGLVSCMPKSPLKREGMERREETTRRVPLEGIGELKKRVMALSFWNSTLVRPMDVGAFAADELKRGLYLSQRVIVPTDVKSDLGTIDFIQGDRVKVAQLVREGQRLGVAVIIIGRVAKIAFKESGENVGLFHEKQALVAVEIEAKVFDVQNGREMLGISRSGEASHAAMAW